MQSKMIRCKWSDENSTIIGIDFINDWLRQIIIITIAKKRFEQQTVY